jgi:myosin heavy subunit
LDGQAQDYNFIKQSNKRIEGVDDAEEYQKLCVSIKGKGKSPINSKSAFLYRNR